MTDVKDQDFLVTLVKAIVSKPNEVSVERTVDEMGVLLTLKVAQDDMGYVIGRKGQTAQAIRTLVKIVGAKNNARVNLKIHDERGMQRINPIRGRNERMNNERMNNERMNTNMDTSSVDDLRI